MPPTIQMWLQAVNLARKVLVVYWPYYGNPVMWILGIMLITIIIAGIRKFSNNNSSGEK
jgi:hypothetical protein